MIDVYVYFNFRSPYCYLASKRMFSDITQHGGRTIWRPLGGWDGRTPPERAAKKVALARQDVSRFAKKMGIPFVPPPAGTDPTLPALASILAERDMRLEPFVTCAMHKEWGEGQDIGHLAVLESIFEETGLDNRRLDERLGDTRLAAQLTANWQEAQQRGVIGVPSFVVGDEIFWGNDRLCFLVEHLIERAGRTPQGAA